MKALRLAALLAATGALGSPPASAATGWRGAGHGNYGGTVVAAPTADRARWSTELATWSNASPVVDGDRIYLTAEPLDLVCVSAANGRVLWRRTARYVDTLAPAERADADMKLAAMGALRDEMAAVEKRLGKLKRKLRKARGTGDVKAQVEALSAQLRDLRTRYDAAPELKPPPAIAKLGSASATPLSTGDAVIGVFGNGVVAAWGRDGTLRWATFLGAASSEMRGYSRGQAASPLLVGGTLVVGLNALTGLDPATGDVRWRGPRFKDFGTPAAVDLGDGWVVVTAGGDVVRVRDGEVVASGLRPVYYSSPVVDGRDLYFVGAEQNPDALGRAAWRVTLEGGVGGVKAREVWHQTLTRAKTFGSPLVRGGRLHTVALTGRWTVLDARSGDVLHDEPLDALGSVWASPVAVGDDLVVADEGGLVATLSTVAPFEVRQRGTLAEARSTPTVAAGTLFVRGLDALLAVPLR